MSESNSEIRQGDVFEIKIPLSVLSFVFLLASVIVFSTAVTIPTGFNAPPLSEQLRTIVWFFVVFWGIGATFTRYVPIRTNPVESFFVNMGLGLAVFPILSVILNILGVPLHWLTFLIVSLVVPSFFVLRSLKQRFRIRLDGAQKTEKKQFEFTIRLNEAQRLRNFFESLRSWEVFYTVLVVFFASVMFYVYVKGAFAYPWLEDGDSWQHATAAKYVSIFKTYSIPKDMYVAHYIEPYPPSYATLMGVTHQLNSQISWSLKFFNSLVVCLGVVFFYVFVRKFSSSSKLALYATFLLVAVHNYSSHFIWAQALNVAIFYPAFYTLESLKDDRRWVIIASLIIASILVIQTITAIFFGVYLLTYILLKSVMEKRIQKLVFLVGVIGFLLAVSLYWIPAFIKFGASNVFNKIFYGSKSSEEFDFKKITPTVSGDSSVDRVYALPEFIHAADPTHIAQPIGMGEVYFGLLLFSLLYLLTSRGKEPFVVLTLCWLFLALLGIESAVLPVSLQSSRNWTFLAIFSAIVCGKGMIVISEQMKVHPILRVVVSFLIVFGILMTSSVTKYKIQTSIWPQGNWVSETQFQTYLNTKSIPPNTPVFSACNSDDYVIGFDKLTFPWDREFLDLKENKLPYVSRDELHKFLKNKKFQFMILDPSCFDRCSKKQDPSMCITKWEALKSELDNSSESFQIAYANADSLVYYIV